MKPIIALILSLFTAAIFAQTEINGLVIDQNMPIAYANIILKNSNNEIVTGVTSDFDGYFTINTKKGNYKLTISYVGYTNYNKDINLENNINLGVVTLQEDASQLDEVVITSRKKLIEQKADRVVFNVENSITASSGDALDALKVAPGLQVQNGIIKMFGKGTPRVMVNNKMVPLTNEELIGYLNSLSASDIKKIEIIATPPAQYEASGNGGLINIILKEGQINSWKNTTSVIHNIDCYNYTTLRNSLLFKKNKVNLLFSVDKTKGHIRGEESFQVYYPTSTWDINIDTKDSKEAFSGRLLLDYDVTDKFTIGMQYFGNNNKPSINDVSKTTITNTQNTIDSLLMNKGNDVNKKRTHSLNLHTAIKLDTLGRKLSFDADYFDFNADKERTLITESFNVNNDFLNTNLSAITASEQSIKNLSFKADMEHPLEFANLSYGGKLSQINSISNITFLNTITGTPVLDTNISNSFTYKENIQALYLSANKKINEALQLQFGLRYENTQTEGFSKELNKSTTNKYSKLFPSLFLSYNKEENDFSFSYAKRIQRPRFNHLNPFRVFVSSNTYSEGNPFLQPTFNDNFSVKHTYKNKLTTNLFYNIRSQASGIIFSSNIADNTQIVTRENFFNQHTIGIEESYIYSTLKWLQSQNTISAIYNTTNFTKNVNAKPQNGFAYLIASNNSIVLNDKNKLQIDAVYNSKSQSDLFTVGDTFSLDLGYNTSFLNKDLQFSVVVKDVFATSFLNNLESTVNGVRQVYGQNRNNRYVRFSLNYSFGNKKINVKNRQVGNSEETRRAN